jgi:hypothetical protein
VTWVDSAAGSAGIQWLQGMILHMNWSNIDAVKTVSPWANQTVGMGLYIVTSSTPRSQSQLATNWQPETTKPKNNKTRSLLSRAKSLFYMVGTM